MDGFNHFANADDGADAGTR